MQSTGQTSRQDLSLQSIHRSATTYGVTSFSSRSSSSGQEPSLLADRSTQRAVRTANRPPAGGELIVQPVRLRDEPQPPGARAVPRPPNGQVKADSEAGAETSGPHRGIKQMSVGQHEIDDLSEERVFPGLERGSGPHFDARGAARLVLVGRVIDGGLIQEPEKGVQLT